MSLTTFDAPLRLELIPSRLLRYYLVVLHAWALLAILSPNRLPWLVTVLILLGILTSAVHSYRTLRHERQTQPGMRWVWQEPDHWHDLSAVSDWQMQPDLFLSPWLIVVGLRNQDNERRSLLIWKDQLDIDCYRTLYRRLKFRRAQPRQSVAAE